MFNIGMENKPYEYTIKHDGIRAPYVRGMSFGLKLRFLRVTAFPVAIYGCE